MIRSFSHAVILARQSLTNHDTRIAQKIQPLLCQYVASRSLHATTVTHAKKKSKQGKTQTGELEEESIKVEPQVSKEMRQAVVKVAKSLPGEWTKTAEDLMTRLKMQQRPEGPVQEAASQDAAPHDAIPHDAMPDQPDKKSLLHTMGIGRSDNIREMRRQEGGKARRRGMDDDMGDSVFSRSQDRTLGTPFERRRGNFDNLYGVPRLGVFNVKKLKAEANKQPMETVDEEEDLWQKEEKESIKRAKGGVPRNAFEEMTRWTKQGLMWKFPVDNEEDMHEEKKYKFHDHIFLDHHLKDFPDKGPIRKFMELAILGLSMNPWLTVPEKVEHIRWYDQYFRRKKITLIRTLGEDGKMKEIENVKTLEQ